MAISQVSDETWMREALAEASTAAARGEVPVGAVAVRDGAVVARAHNIREADGNPLGHAELLLLRQLTMDDGRWTMDERTDRRLSEQSERSSLVPAPKGRGRPSSNWRLTDVILYVTCEPCLMCAGALLQTRIPRLVYGCADPKAGACGSLYDVTNDPRLNHRIAVTAGCLGTECGALLSRFFRGLRADR